MNHFLGTKIVFYIPAFSRWNKKMGKSVDAFHVPKQFLPSYC